MFLNNNEEGLLYYGLLIIIIDYSKWMFNQSPAMGTSWMLIEMERCTYLGFAVKQYEFTNSISSLLNYTCLELFDQALWPFITFIII